MAGKLTKSQTVVAMAEATELNKKQVVAFFDALTALAYKEVKKCGEFVLPGFGKMVKVKRLARMGVNPATGEKIKIAAKTVAKFRLAKAAKEAVL
jgi:DNA-binding protein HU-beta